MIRQIDQLLKKGDQLKIEVQQTEHEYMILSSKTFFSILDDMEKLISDIKIRHGYKSEESLKNCRHF